MNLKMDCDIDSESVHKYKFYGTDTVVQDLLLVWQDLQLTEAHKGSD
jgi:hypothetical protein